MIGCATLHATLGAGPWANRGTGASRPRRRPAAAAPAGYLTTKTRAAHRLRRATMPEGGT